jgi:hypothetical protein
MNWTSGRIYDPDLVETLRSADQIRRLGGQPREDGTLSSRWVPTSKGLANRTRDDVSSIAFRTRARAQLARILAGAAFADGERASNHLRFVSNVRLRACWDSLIRVNGCCARSKLLFALRTCLLIDSV